MKFFALIASVSAIKITSDAAAGQCVSQKQSDEVFDHIDTNGNGEISKRELTKAVQWWLKRANPNDIPDAKEAEQLKDAVVEHAGADRQLNKEEFNSLANDIASHLYPKKCSA